MQDQLTILEQERTINSIDINSNKKLGLYGLLGILQDGAAEHSYRLNFGYEEMLEKGFFWVLIRQKLRIKRWPEWHEKMTIRTWTLPVEGFYGIREYELSIGDELVGECSTIWMILDSKSHRPKEIGNAELTYSPRTDHKLGFRAGKIRLPQDMTRQKELVVQNTDLDLHNHVNNIKYSEWMLNSIPFHLHSEYAIREFEINFLSETFLGDEIAIYSNIDSLTEEDSENTVYFSAIKSSNQKTAFTAKMDVERI